MQIRPNCQIDGCNRIAHWPGNYRRDGSRIYRKYCGPHHKERGKRFNEIKAQTDRRSTPTCNAAGCKKKTNLMGTDINGNPLHTVYCPEHVNLSTAYAALRKNYCENIDGRLGNYCTSNIWWEGMLDVDHIDENPLNNDPENLQTLCKNCHSYKGNQFIKIHGVTPGRKTLGIR